MLNSAEAVYLIEEMKAAHSETETGKLSVFDYKQILSDTKHAIDNMYAVACGFKTEG